MLLIEEIFKSKKNEYSDAFNLRIHRGLSWLKKANTLNEDADLQFLSLWVSLNALYAQDLLSAQHEQSLPQFIHQIFQKDAQGKIAHILWEKFSQPIQQLLDNQYAYQGFWDYQNKTMSAMACKAGLEQEKQQVRLAQGNKASAEILLIVFQRLSTLHHQLVHGGSAYHSAVNRKQLQDGCRILLALLPVFILVLLENAQSLDLGKPYYPMVQVC